MGEERRALKCAPNNGAHDFYYSDKVFGSLTV